MALTLLAGPAWHLEGGGFQETAALNISVAPKRVNENGSHKKLTER